MQDSVIEYIETSKLIPYVNNARTHSESQIKQISASIKEFGFTSPVLIDNENGIIAGHGRVAGAELIGMDKVPTINLSHLSNTQKKAYILADNRLAENAGWDMTLVDIELKSLLDDDFDIELTGFDVDDIDVNFEEASIDEQGKLDELTPFYVQCPKCGSEFDAKA